jgi:hypothetical protein
MQRKNINIHCYAYSRERLQRKANDLTPSMNPLKF